MSTPQNEINFKEFYNRRRVELLAQDSINARESKMIQEPIEQPSGSNPILNALSTGAGLVKSGWDKLQEFRQSSMEGIPLSNPPREEMGFIESLTQRPPPMSIEETTKLRNSASSGILPYISPAIPGGSGATSLARKLRPFRRKGSALAKHVETHAPIAAGTRSASSSSLQKLLGDNFEDMGYKIFTKNLGGENPSRFARTIASVPPGQRVFLQEGALKGLSENLANMPRLTREAQQNLLSPAGRERLKFAFQNMPPHVMERFIQMVETGQHQRASRWVTLVSVMFPLARKFGRDLIDFVFPE